MSIKNGSLLVFTNFINAQQKETPLIHGAKRRESALLSGAERSLERQRQALASPRPIGDRSCALAQRLLCI